jgi:hypothetical protein
VVRRSTAIRLVPAALVAFGLALASNGCDDLKIAHSQGGPADPSSPGADGGTGEGGVVITDGGTKTDATTTPATKPYYADVQAALATRRFAGPKTGVSARGHCTPSYFVWVDQNKSVHSWRGTTKARIDYGFTDNGFHAYLFPSDAFFSIERPFVFVDVQRMDTANVLVTSLPYSENFVSANDGVLLLDQKESSVDLGGTKVRRWNAASGVTEDITGVLATRESPSSFNGDTLVIPGAKDAPYPLYIVDVVKKTSKTVTYSNGNILLQTEQSASGLLVAYVSAGSALRLYKGNLDTAAARIELDPDIDGRPAYFEDPPTNGQEHAFRAPIATWGNKVLFATDFGIWSYDLVTTALVPVQLNGGKAPGRPDFLCVMRDAGLLVYKAHGDLDNQIWAVPLSATFP